MDVLSEELGDMIMKNPEFREVKVIKSRVSNTFNYTIVFEKLPGKQELIEVSL